MKGLFCLLLMIASAAPAAEKLGVIEEPFGKPNMLIHNGTLYLYQGFNGDNTVHRYALRGLAHLGSFCKHGQGPGEVPGWMTLSPAGGGLQAAGTGKLVLFGFDGRLLGEKRNPLPFPRYQRFTAAGANQVAQHLFLGRENKITFELFDADLKQIRVLATKEKVFFKPGERMVNQLVACFDFAVWRDRIVVGYGSRGLRFDVFDAHGRLVKTIDLPCRRRPVTEAEKKKLIAEDREEKAALPARFRIGGDPVFPEEHPAFESFSVDNGVIYAFSRNVRQGTQDAVLIGLDGKIKRSVSLPWQRNFLVHEGVYYYMVEDPGAENWILYAEKVR